jgi:serine/threonine protein kinase
MSSGIYGIVTFDGDIAVKHAKPNCEANNLLEYTITSMISCKYVVKHELIGTDLVMKRYPKTLSLAVNDETLSSHIKDIIEGLSHIHACGYTHMDIKPSNIMTDSHAVVIDLGVARRIGDPISMVGSRYFRAPEVHVGSTLCVDKSIDYWSVGMLIYCHVRKPFACNGFTNVNASWCKLLGHDVSGDDVSVYERLMSLQDEFNNHVLSVSMNINDKYLSDTMTKCLKLNPSERSL